ncbi:SgcJ/EcaC family oxidoreductase [Muricauda sp. CAU 1633]|uniref:YybH family protein n=1 Tax=Allomuricauda sp. CAU 1633 TaxID=2816036 RepID=UPI001A8F1D4B|nr:SgcJ/EcaC family oxidoreductase [Muricauda sp. CAU 1633]MBO0324294.1 SgcJ/EcaC family oxidoreductase [Muricauda sp. CAU 1633]
MKRLGYSFTLCCLFISCTIKKAEPKIDYEEAQAQINTSIEEWDTAWEEKNVDQAIKHYANDTDWTNAFGDRVQSKEELEELLSFIFSLDFVMAGENDYGENEITFLNDSIATARSLNIRKNQRWPDGSKMDDRHANHLRVYKNMDGEWLIINHMISQAWPKQQTKDTLADIK